MMVDELVGEIISYLKSKKQLERLPQIAEALTAASFTQTDINLATVTTAVRLTDKQKQTLKATLSKTFRRPVRIRQQLDPEIIGGMRISLGGKVIDTSLSQQLNQLNEVLLYD